MDSVTQIALGAAIGETILGKRVGARAPLWGAICGTLPDLDVLVDLGDSISNFTYHRSFSHSLLVLTALTPLVAWLIGRIHPQHQDQKLGWMLLVFLALITHSMLDSLTIYGTQLLWPLSDIPFAVGSIFIIDPIYTIPLAMGVLVAIGLRHSERGLLFNRLGLVLSTAYLIWGIGAKLSIESETREILKAQQVASNQVAAIPTPFNSLLWRVLVMQEDQYLVGYRSIFDRIEHIKLESRQSNLDLLKGMETHWPVMRLKWFTKGFYSVTLEEGNIIMDDLRMGLGPKHVFRFKIGEFLRGRSTPVSSQRVPIVRQTDRLTWVWRRIWS